jgi:protein involved in polysaccharide export with SLBB domain
LIPSLSWADDATTQATLHVLAAGDLLHIHIENLEIRAKPLKPFDVKMHVDAEGNILPPFLRSPIHVAGLTLNDGTKAVDAAYATNKQFGHVTTSLELLEVAKPSTGPSGPVLASGDLVRVTIADVIGPGLKTTTENHVADDGTLPVLLITPLRAAGVSTGEFTVAVRKAYHDANLINYADVSVERVDNAAKISAGPIERGDHLRVRLWDLKGPGVETSLEPDVDEHGFIPLPQAKPMKVLGLNEGQAAAEIQRIYREANLVQNMMVSVERLSAREGL